MQEFPWFNSYPKGIPKNIDPDSHSSFLELIEASAKKYGDAEAYVNMGKSLSFVEIEVMTRDFAAFLQNKLGLQKGDIISIQMPNLLQAPVALFGALRAGLTVVNTNPLYTAREMEYQFKDTEAKAIVILANFAHNLQKIIANTSIEHVIITEIGDMLGGIKGRVVNFVVKNVRKMVPPFKLEHSIRFNAALAMGKKLEYKKPDLQSEDVAFLQYTGGTTGVSKGAMLTHRNIIANMEQISAWMSPKLKVNQEIMVTALPTYHIFALTVNVLAMLNIGAKNILITNPRDLPAFIKELKKYPFSVMTGVNTLFNALLNHPDFKTVDFSHFKLAVGGGMAVQDVVATKWREVTGVALVEGYGLTETSPVLTCNPIDDTEKIGTIGLPIPGTEIKVLDENGNEVEQGKPGEICAKGPQVMKGYWKRLKENEDVFINGYFKTGDIGLMDEDGFFKIVDRKKEMINVSGFNVYPNDVENVISMHPKVLEVGAIGIPDPKSNEVVKVFIVKKDESLTKEELVSYCKENMTAYKVPKAIEFRDELPKSNVGKILRRVLKEDEEKRSTQQKPA